MHDMQVYIKKKTETLFSRLVLIYFVTYIFYYKKYQKLCQPFKNSVCFYVLMVRDSDIVQRKTMKI